MSRAPRVSEHALVRYLERVYGLDLDAVRREILPEAEADAVARLGDGQFPVENRAGTFYVIVRDSCVVTVYDEERP